MVKGYLIVAGENDFIISVFLYFDKIEEGGKKVVPFDPALFDQSGMLRMWF